MPGQLWREEINFTSALLLHSCITVLLKEALNMIAIGYRLASRRFHRKSSVDETNRTTIVLDGYTSIVSRDYDAELAELYFTNTGLVLLTVSLASAIIMNLFLSVTVLNVVVAGTFGLCYIASALTYRRSRLRFILALRRAGRFIWSDTPFVNFFSLIYVAVVLQGVSTLRLRDYVALRSVAVVELVFMKAYIASANVDRQVELLRALCKTQLVVVKGKPLRNGQVVPRTERNSIRAFTTAQRMNVMLLKTSVGYDLGSVRGSCGPSSMPIPDAGFYVEDDAGEGQWRVYRIHQNVLVIADRLRRVPAKGTWMRFCQQAHGVLLRTLGKVRVVYLLKEDEAEDSRGETEAVNPFWYSNVNFVSGISESVLQTYTPMVDTACERGIVI